MIAYTALDGVFLHIHLLRLNGLDNRLRRLLDRFFAIQLLVNILHHLLVALRSSFGVLIVQVRDLDHGSTALLRLGDPVIAFLHELVIEDCIIAVLAVDNGVCGLLDLTLQLVLRGLLQVLAILLACGFHEGVRYWL